MAPAKTVSLAGFFQSQGYDSLVERHENTSVQISEYEGLIPAVRLTNIRNVGK